MSWFNGTGGNFEKELKKKKKQEQIEKHQELVNEKREMEEKNKRFEIILEQDLVEGMDYRAVNVIKDKKTGVCYLWSRDLGGSGLSGLTILVDQDGKPVIEVE